MSKWAQPAVQHCGQLPLQGQEQLRRCHQTSCQACNSCCSSAKVVAACQQSTTRQLLASHSCCSSPAAKVGITLTFLSFRAFSTLWMCNLAWTSSWQARVKYFGLRQPKAYFTIVLSSMVWHFTTRYLKKSNPTVFSHSGKLFKTKAPRQQMTNKCEDKINNGRGIHFPLPIKGKKCRFRATSNGMR